MPACRAASPVCILGTTAASAALFSAIAQRGRRIALAAGSRLMDTGGAKGQAIPLTPIEVVDRAHETLGIEPALVINEYGMTEMCSQLYDATPFQLRSDSGLWPDHEAHSGHITGAGEVNRMSDKVGYTSATTRTTPDTSWIPRETRATMAASDSSRSNNIKTA